MKTRDRTLRGLPALALGIVLGFAARSEAAGTQAAGRVTLEAVTVEASDGRTIPFEKGVLHVLENRLAKDSRVVTLTSLGAPLALRVDPKKIDAAMKDHALKDGPGCAVAVIQRGAVVHARGYGMADLERGVAITPQTVFDIASTSKQFTATSILLLAADGKLSLDDDIRKFLPELPVLSKTPITIRHLLHHTGGLRDYMPLLLLRGSPKEGVTTSRETVAVLARQRGLEFEPGAKHSYSNTGYFVLAQIVERASKQTMAQFVAERIFKPLGMTSSLVFDDHRRIIPGRAIGYQPKEEGGGWQLRMSQWEQTGDGAVMTTVLDLAKWDANFYQPKVGGAALLAGLHQRGKTSDGKVLDYAAGLKLGTYRGQETVSHGGSWAGYRAQLERYPKLQTSIVVLCNNASVNPSALARAIADVALDKQLGPRAAAPAAGPPVKLAPAELDRWVARYREVSSGEVTEIVRTGDTLAASSQGRSFTLVATSKTTFAITGGPFTLEFAGGPPRRTIALRGGRVAEQYEELVPYTPSAAELAALAGRYFSGELNLLWVLSIKDGALVANGVGLDDEKLVASRRDEYVIPASSGGLTFKRGAKGVTGFTIAGVGVVFSRL